MQMSTSEDTKASRRRESALPEGHYGFGKGETMPWHICNIFCPAALRPAAPRKLHRERTLVVLCVKGCLP